MNRLPPGVHVVRKRLRDGTERAYYYWRATRAPLPHPDSPGFQAALRAAKQAEATSTAGTFGALIQEYKRSPAWAAIGQRTRASYLAAFSRLAELDAIAVADFRRRHALQIRDAMAATPGNAKVTMKALSMLLNFAVEREYLEINPVKAVKSLPIGERHRWPDEAIAFACAVLPENLRRAVVLGLYTGQRRGDCAAMLWSHYDGAGIEVTQIKTGARLWIACHKALRKELAAWKEDATAVTILTNADGKPWASSNVLGSAFSAACRKHPELDGLTFHGLRKTAAAKLAEAGCTPHEIQAITGHQSLAMLQHYTKEAGQRQRSTAAILKLETATKFTKKRGAK